MLVLLRSNAGYCVALRKESVDRNVAAVIKQDEMQAVALRKESVDRNIGVGTTRDRRGVSLSARRAWIEIVMPFFAVLGACVALRKESVDRNMGRPRAYLARGCGRSPQGERG